MKKHFVLLIVLLIVIPVVLLGCGGGGGKSDPAPVILFAENFSAYTEGQSLSSDWTKINGSTASGCRIQESTKAIYLDVVNNFAVYNTSAAVNWDNYSFSFRFKLTGTDPSFSVFFRTYPGAENACAYYLLAFLQDGTLLLYKNPDDQAMSAPTGQSATKSYSVDTYYPVKIVVNGANFKVYFNNEINPCIDYTDDGSIGQVLATGTIGFMRATGALYIDDIIVTKL